MVDVPKVSIVLINYNGAKLSKECVESLNKISYENYNIIVVDNASTDNSLALLKEYELENTQIIESKQNLGFSGGNQIGIRYALLNGADYVLLLNNDTEVDSRFLSELIKHANSQTVTISKICYYDKKDVIWYGGGRIVPNKGKMEHLNLGEKDCSQVSQPETCDFATGCCLLIHRDIVNEIGVFDDAFFMYYEDADFCIRLKKTGKKIIYVPSSIIWHKVSSSSGGELSPLSIYYMERNRLYLLKKHWKYFFPMGWLYVILSRMVKYCLLFVRRDTNLRYYWAGLLDFFKGSFGKSNRKFV